ncbi:preprotein translocase subunit YajC [Bacteroidia bacterium]|nr:preprotein translocase subunit YajC [Bacteroidia bacterium]
MLNTIILFANTATQTADGSTPKGGFGWTNILLLVGIVVIFYFFMIRPQQKRSKEQKKFRSALGKGQKVVTIGGIHGRIVETQENTVTIEVENGGRLRMEKSAIASNVDDVNIETK